MNETHPPAPPASTAADREVRLAGLDAWELRASNAGDGSHVLTGYAAVYDAPTTLYDGRALRLDEQIRRGAFSRVLGEQPDVHLVINHDMSRAVARTGLTGVGALDLSEDATGLKVHARLDPTDPDVQAVVAKMKRGIVDQMSFAFTVKGDELATREIDGKTVETRTITEIGNLYDVSVCAQGAYPQTSASIRGRLAVLEGTSVAAPSGVGAECPAVAAPSGVGGTIDAAPPAGVTNPRARLAAAAIRCHVAAHHTPTSKESK